MLDQVREDDGPVDPADPSATEPAYDRDGLHSGIGGLAHVLEEVRLARPWTAEEATLADAVAGRLRSRIPVTTDCTLFDGLAGYRRGTARPRGGRDGRGAGAAGLDRRRRRLAAEPPWARLATCPRPASTTPRSVRRACCWPRCGRGGAGCPGRTRSSTTRSRCSSPRPSTSRPGPPGGGCPSATTPSPAPGRCRTGRTARPGSPAPSPWPARSWTDRTWSPPR